MIHNIYPELLFNEIELSELFKPEENYLKEENREYDPLFEFQDWNLNRRND